MGLDSVKSIKSHSEGSMGKRGQSFGVDVEIVYPVIPELPFAPLPLTSKII